MSSLHQRAKELFIEALARPPAARSAFITSACGDDPALRREVESLLAFHEEGESAGDGPSRRGADPATGPEQAKDPFAPGEVFARRYRMVTRIGRGGMGDVWRADDLVLQTPVALKFIYWTGPEARASVLNEVRLARQITHPAVCRVFDVGEADGQVFFSMELVRGEDLATLLRRVGRLPAAKVIDIARQLCVGLAAAHARGVLHRDLKPANVLIDDDGQIRITDFGIAIMRTGAADGSLVGTPGYMAPEQLTPGSPLTERTDLYALGLVLYELLVGHHPFKGSGTSVAPARPSTLVPNISHELEQIILQALSSDPQDRPGSASAMAVSLLRASRVGRPGWKRPWVAGAAVAVLLSAAAVASLPRFFAGGARSLTEQDTIVLADLVNTTGEPVFDGTLKVALAVALEQTPFLKVFPDARVRETLRLMNRSPDDTVTRAIAREIARREHLKALLSGSIGSLGRNFVIALEAINAETGDVMAREQVEVPGKEQVLTGLGQAASRLREELGESLASIETFDVPLPRATTPSLEALHAYSLALDEGRVIPRLEAIPHLKRAIELDPDFALAQAHLSAVYANTGQTALAPEYSRKAFDLRDRVSERERFFISFRYFRDATQAWDKALDLARSWTATYPREAFAFNSLGTAFVHLGQYEQSIEPFRQALRLDPRFAPPYSNLAGVLMALNRFDEAKAIFQQAAQEQIEFSGVRRISYLLALIDGDAEAMARHLESSVGVRETNAAFGWEARSSAFAGRLQIAHDQYRRGIQMALQGDFKEVAAQLSIEDAETHAVMGQCVEARREVAAGLGLSRDNFSQEKAGRILALCGSDSQALALSGELAQRLPEATLTARVSLPVIAAAIAVQRGEPRRALELLEPVRVFDRAPAAEFWPSYLRGQSLLQLKQGREASAEFQSILDRRGENPNSPLYPLAYLGRARAASLSGDTEKARQAYRDFLARWEGADANLPQLGQARQELARLQ